MLERAAYHLAVETVATRQPIVDEAEEAWLALVRGLAQQHGAHHGREGKGHHRGYNHRHGDCNSELAVELSGDSRQEAHGHEHSAQNQRHGYKRAAEAVHGTPRGLLWLAAVFLHDAVDVFHHHNGVVHHNTDSKDEAKQCEHIEREAEYEHHTEGAYQRYGHGDNGDERGAPVLKREEHHKYHQQQRLEEGAVHMVD